MFNNEIEEIKERYLKLLDENIELLKILKSLIDRNMLSNSALKELHDVVTRCAQTHREQSPNSTGYIL